MSATHCYLRRLSPTGTIWLGSPASNAFEPRRWVSHRGEAVRMTLENGRQVARCIGATVVKLVPKKLPPITEAEIERIAEALYDDGASDDLWADAAPTERGIYIRSVRFVAKELGR